MSRKGRPDLFQHVRPGRRRSIFGGGLAFFLFRAFSRYLSSSCGGCAWLILSAIFDVRIFPSRQPGLMERSFLTRVRRRFLQMRARLKHLLYRAFLRIARSLPRAFLQFSTLTYQSGYVVDLLFFFVDGTAYFYPPRL